MLAPLGPTGRATGVHEKQWSFGRHGNRLDDLPAVVFQQVVNKEIPTLDHRTLRGILTRIPSPDQDLLHFNPLFMGRFHRLVGLGLVVDQLSIAVVAIYGHQDATARVSNPSAARYPAEAPKHLGMDDTQARAGKHG